MQLKINGETKKIVPVPVNLQQVLDTLGYLQEDAPRFVVAYNQTLVNPDQYLKTTVYEGDSVDVLSVITGG